MFCDLVELVGRLRMSHFDWSRLFLQNFYFLAGAFLAAELAFVTAGYLSACRLFNSQIRAVDRTLLAWVAALVCYKPFLGLFFTSYFGYRSELDWTGVFPDNSPAIVLWGSLILLTYAAHMLCDSSLGLRFSNLTNRGIVTNGMYRLSKHPAYVIKNIRWWMVSIPFLCGGPWNECLRLSLLLIGVNAIYVIRAYTEEKLLSSDPAYVLYALWMDEHGALNFLRGIIPAMTFSYRLAKWRASGLDDSGREIGT
jgi:protein-S-isoprenylcysteine O-methyltransferase Ste14